MIGVPLSAEPAAPCWLVRHLEQLAQLLAGRGASGKPWSQMIRGMPLLVGEGIEDVCSAILDFPKVRAICAVSLPAMLALDPPDSVGDVLLLQQCDRPGSPAAPLLWRVIEHFEAGGHRVWLWARLAKVKD